jgi:CheY-like chemotaxis protein
MSEAEAVDVLLVEEDGPFSENVGSLLTARGCSWVRTGSSSEAVLLARERSPACVLLDLESPHVDGLAVARFLRLDTRTRGCHLHCLATAPDAQVRDLARRSGYERVVPRSADPAGVVGLVTEQARHPELGLVSGLTFEEATGLLDWRERCGCTELQVLLDDAGTFSVRCTCPQGRRLIRDQDGQVGLVGGPPEGTAAEAKRTVP